MLALDDVDLLALGFAVDLLDDALAEDDPAFAAGFLAVDFEDVVFLDRQYIEQWSFWLDISILFRTIPAVLRRTGAF